MMMTVVPTTRPRRTTPTTTITVRMESQTSERYPQKPRRSPSPQRQKLWILHKTTAIRFLWFLIIISGVVMFFVSSRLLVVVFVNNNDETSTTSLRSLSSLSSSLEPTSPLSSMKASYSSSSHYYNHSTKSAAVKWSWPRPSSPPPSQSPTLFLHNATAGDVTTAAAIILPRPFVKWFSRYDRSSISNTTNHLPCYPPDDATPKGLLDSHEGHLVPTDRGFLFAKGKKVGSSTLGTINVRLAIQEAQRQQKNFTICNGRWDHATPSKLRYSTRDRNRSVLWTNVREPTQRWISHFFYFVLKYEKKTPTDENFATFLNSTTASHYLRRLDPLGDLGQWRRNPIASIQNILQEYDFIGVTERMEESAVVFMMLMDLNIADILYLDAKGSGGYDDYCYLITKSFVSPYMKEFFQSPQWHEKVKWDTLLYQAVNESLDLTIDQTLGRDAFNVNLEQFRSAQAKVREVCKGREVFPCTSDGKRNKNKDCLWKDSGCGKSCIDEAVTLLGL